MARLSPWSGLAIVGFALAMVTRADPDLWGHVRYGLDIIADRALHSIDPYSFTQDRPWLNHEWLSELAMASAYLAAGSHGLMALKAFFATLVIALAWRALSAASLGAKLGALAWMIFASVHMLSTVRPQLWSWLAMAALAFVLAKPTPRAYSFLPLAFCIWANAHGGWVVGLGVLGAWMAGGGVIELGRRGRTLALVGACALATLVTPNGIRLWEFALETIRFERAISEWRPLYEGASVAEWAAWVGTSLGVVAVLWRRRTIAWPPVLVMAMLAIAALRVMRIGSLYATVAVVLLSPAIAAAWPALSRPRRPIPSQHRWLVLVPLVAALVAGRQIVSATRGCIASEGPWATDREAIAALSAAPPGRLVTLLEWGQIAIWHLGPRIRVSLDGRRETVYSEAFLRLHDEVVAGSSRGLETLSTWNPDYVLLPASAITVREWLVGRGYSLVLETPRAFLVSRVPLAAQPVQSAGPRCFPQ